MEKIKPIWVKLKENQRYAWAFLALLVTFLISKSFPAEIITSESCQNGKCQAVLEEPSISPKNPKYYINDIFSSEPNKFYRLTFRERSNQETTLRMKATNPLDEEEIIGEIGLKKSYGNNFHELIFSASGKSTDILFEKAGVDGAEILISDVRISRLNISDESEISNLKKTIATESSSYVLSQKQEKNDYAFNQLIEPKLIFGEVFKNDLDFITEIELDLDIVKQGDGGGEKFKLTLREADFDGITPEVKSKSLAELKFSFDGIEQYRQENGKFKFPIFARVKKDSYYFIGLENDRVEVNKFNHISFRGTKDSTSYTDGATAVKKDSQSYPAFGDIYFRVFGMISSEYNNQHILSGTTIEDLGKSRGIFKFRPTEGRLSILDVYDQSSEVDFDENRKILFEKNNPETENYFTYKFETIFPFDKFQIRATRENPDWSNVKILYSYDNNDWKEVPFQLSEENTGSKKSTIQEFDFTFNEKRREALLYLKILSDERDKKSFGLDKLEITADLNLK